jgi:hypothetical protein
MNADVVDNVVKCVAFITMVAGPPGDVEEGDKIRRWVWSDDESKIQINLALSEHDYRVELVLDDEENSPAHPRYYMVIGWCALHSIPCYITMGDDHWMRVSIAPDTKEHAH